MFLFSGIKGIMHFQEDISQNTGKISAVTLQKPSQKRIETPNPEFIHSVVGAEIPEKCANPTFNKNSDSLFSFRNILKTDRFSEIRYSCIPFCFYKIYLIINVLRI